MDEAPGITVRVEESIGAARDRLLAEADGHPVSLSVLGEGGYIADFLKPERLGPR